MCSSVVHSVRWGSVGAKDMVVPVGVWNWLYKKAMSQLNLSVPSGVIDMDSPLTDGRVFLRTGMPLNLSFWSPSALRVKLTAPVAASL